MIALIASKIMARKKQEINMHDYILPFKAQVDFFLPFDEVLMV